jgi:hypothetical protein
LGLFTGLRPSSSTSSSLAPSPCFFFRFGVQSDDCCLIWRWRVEFLCCVCIPIQDADDNKIRLFQYVLHQSVSSVLCSTNHLFLIALSVLPGIILAISAHLLPLTECSSTIIASSSAVHGFLLMSGFRWLYHRSRHCFPRRPVNCRAMNDQLFIPYLLTSS